MEKTYKLLDHTEPLNADEIRRLYQGFWVFIVKAKFNEHGGLLSGIPVITGTRASDGAFDGIYDKYRSEEYDERTDLNLLPNRGFIGVIGVI